MKAKIEVAVIVAALIVWIIAAAYHHGLFLTTH
jgi:hypothetical protein